MHRLGAYACQKIRDRLNLFFLVIAIHAKHADIIIAPESLTKVVDTYRSIAKSVHGTFAPEAAESLRTRGKSCQRPLSHVNIDSLALPQVDSVLTIAGALQHSIIASNPLCKFETVKEPAAGTDFVPSKEVALSLKKV